MIYICCEYMCMYKCMYAKIYFFVIFVIKIEGKSGAKLIDCKIITYFLLQKKFIFVKIYYNY